MTALALVAQAATEDRQGTGSPLWWVLWCSGAWFAIGLATGAVANRVPMRWMQRDSWLSRLRPFESDGRFYDRHLRIRRWKDLLPEAGDMFRGGFSKRRIRSRDDEHLLRFVAETRRAEYVHWANAMAGVLFLPFLPLWAGAVMVAFGLVLHLPFVIIQRYNRARLVRTLRRRGVYERPGDRRASEGWITP
jgi:glycosyl-4,4'-diaponeurosporenoate acyltransferase